MHWIAPSEKDAANDTLEKRLWAAADQLRANSGLTSQQYSQPVLGLIFLRFAEVRFSARRAVLEKAGASGRRASRVDDPTAYHAEGVIYLAPNARFDALLKLPERADVGKAVNEAMADIEKHNPQLAGVLPRTYQVFTSTLLKELLKKVSEIPATLDYDTFGRVYEYFLGEFAMTEGQQGGEFYTPSSIVKLMVEILEPYHGRILDPACGSGGMFVQSARFMESHRKTQTDRLAVHGQEKVAATVNLCRMNLAVHGLEGDTGFDAPSCSTVYLDKPMRNHTLMQTIARANRVFPGKHSGVIVDYANVFTSLEKALAIYGQGKDGAKPVQDKQKLVEELSKAIDAATIYCANKGVTLAAIEQLPAGDIRRLQRIDDAVNALIAPDNARKEFLGLERLVTTLYKAVKPDPCVVEFTPRAYSLAAIGDAIRAKLNPNPADISKIMGKVAEKLDESITGLEMQARPAPPIDLSKINFEALRVRFKESEHKNTDLEQLKAAIRAQLEKLIRLNRSRADYLAKFEELIEAYNNGSRNIEHTLEDLLVFARTLSAEQERHVREHLSEEELTVFDILTRPDPNLSPEEREEVKKAARQLLDRLKGLLVLEWRNHTQARAQVRLAIEDTLDTGLPGPYTPELYRGKCSAVFEHVFESYQGDGASIYVSAN